ncbi:MAG: PLP-dependent aminotransferase family protein [Bacteroidetes bacterium]|nr:PLP-dependent aminotransferase family protein [Bacteroidota bacterium]
MLLISINNQSKEPIYKQVFHQIKEMIDSGILKPGDKLPSSRIFSEKLGVNRTTITKAYEELWGLGYIESRQGSYSFVRKRTDLANPIIENKKNLIDWNEKNSNRIRTLIPDRTNNPWKKTESGVINFISLSADPRLMPVSEFRKSLNNMLTKGGASLLGYGDPQGYKPLREFIAEQMQKHCITISAEQIIITQGSQNGIELVLKLLVNEGSEVVIESPTYSSAIPLFNYYGAKTIGVSVKDDGMDLDELETILQTRKIALIYTIPNFQNPTGTTTNQAHRERLLALCEQYKVLLVEDGFQEELKYYGKVILPIKSMDKNEVVIYLGTFSKILFPGLRIGWIAAAKECISELTLIMKSAALSGNSLDQAALYSFCRSGYYDLHIKRIHRIYRKRMELTIKTIKEYFPLEHITFTKPNGGYTLWFELKNTTESEDEIIAYLLSNKVAVSPGKLFYNNTPNGKFFRISIANRDEKEIAQGIQRLGKALTVLYDNEKV